MAAAGGDERPASAPEPPVADAAGDERPASTPEPARGTGQLPPALADEACDALRAGRRLPTRLPRRSKPPPPVAPPDTPEAALREWQRIVRAGSFRDAQKALRDGWAPVNAADGTGCTALMRACVSGGPLLELLLGCPACDVNATGASDGATPLLLAARHRSARVVHALLRRGAVLTRDRTGASVLHRAAANTDARVVQLLVGDDPLLIGVVQLEAAREPRLLQRVGRRRPRTDQRRPLALVG